VTQTITFHPYAETYPLLEGEEYETFKADIASRGVREALKYRVVNGKKQGLDGRNRLRACTDLSIPCPEEKVSVADAEVEDYIDSLNLHRRHLSSEQRQERVLQMRARGRSMRQIADTLGVGKSTVQRDISDAEASAGVPNGTPGDSQPSTTSAKRITGSDGKPYRSRKTKRRKKAQPCERCSTIGVPACPTCRKNFPSGFPPRDAGDDTETERKAREGEKAKPKVGAQSFDWQGYWKTFGVVARSPEAIAKGYPAFKDTAEYTEAQDLLSRLATLFKTVHQNLTGKKR
jgi:hypothetical protein